MPTQVSIQAEPVLDPRGARKQPVDLAKRLTTLEDKSILLFDNTQLSGHLHIYGQLLEWIRGSLQSKHAAKCSFGSRNLFDGGHKEIIKLADDISQSSVHAVVVALCKGGMTQPTSLFAAELERRGLPCVQICTEHGIALAGITAASYVPGLPIILVDPATGEGEEFGKTEAEAIIPEIVSGLTTEPTLLLKNFNAKFSAGDVPSEEGKISLPVISAIGADSGSRLLVTIESGQFAADLYEQLCSADMCDGFPVIPPSEARVNAMLALTDLEPDQALVAECPPSGSSITVKSIAVNAVMAGCRPEYFPILIAAFQAISEAPYRLFQGAITTHPGGNAVIISGPLAAEIGIHSGAGCLGPGFRANATIGRAINMTIMNVTRAIPNKSDLSVFGSPAEFTYCFAESIKETPWKPLHEDLYGPEVTSVTVHKCEAPHNVLEPRSGGPEALLKTIAATAATPGGNNLIHLGQLLVLLNPGQARMIAKEGWSKREVKEFLFETARHPAGASERRHRSVFPPYFHKLEKVPVMRSPEDVIVLVCGGKGPHAMVGIPWGLASAVSRAVTRKDGSPIKTIKELMR